VKTILNPALAASLPLCLLAQVIQPDVLFRERGIGAYGDYTTPENWVPASEGLTDKRVDRPWMVIHTLSDQFAYDPVGSRYKSGPWILSNLVDIVAKGGNFMPSIGPDAQGKFHPAAIQQLEYVGEWLKVNGEAIYGTRNWKKSIQWTEGKRPGVDYGKEYMTKYDIADLTGKPTGDKAVIEAFFTTKGDTLYVITPRWPGEKLLVKDVEVAPNATVTMLGVAQPIRWDRSGSDLTIQTPALSIDEVPCQYAYVFKITGVK